ncbi:MAG TPA: PLDc N-terminal domain-containing protein [Amnibacterium sp.]|uniref:PLDc N-terminal domain-containing protein n=1 Tax=Amnibacterium sp. TaxID=1872496 RepID=UPI002F954CE3
MARIELVVALVVLVLEIYSIVTCILTPDAQVKGVPKLVWLLLIVLIPLLGSVLWLGVGRDRDRGVPQRAAAPAKPAVGPSGYSAMTSEERIRRMEEDLRRLERESGEDGVAPRD